MPIAVQRVGSFRDEPVHEARLESATGVVVTVLDWGVTVRDWRVPVAGGLRPVVLGFPEFAPYPDHSPHFGSLAGRVAGRVAGAQFTLDGQVHRLPANEGANSLHGGPEGLGRRVWSLEPDSAANALLFTLVSPDGDAGYPGTVALSALYRLDGDLLTLELSARADRPTPLSLIQHHYFNLGTAETVLDHTVTIAASVRTETDADAIPTGAILPVAGTRYDFREGRTLRDAAGAPLDYDDNLVLAARRDPAEPVARVLSPEGDLRLSLWTDRPGLQLYDAPGLDCPVPGHEGRRYGPHAGLCLEDQAFPGALQHAHFPDIVIGPERPYRHACAIEIAES